MRGLSGRFCGCSQGLEHVESWAIEDCSRPGAVGRDARLANHVRLATVIQFRNTNYF